MKIETPRGAIFQSGKGKARLVWNPNFGARYTGKFKGAQKFIDSEVLRLSRPMVPLQTGMLEKSGTLGTVVGTGEVEYIAPYARYQYYGKLMVGRAPKRLANPEKPLNYHGGPMRGALWFERMKMQHKKTILEGAAKYMRRGT